MHCFNTFLARKYNVNVSIFITEFNQCIGLMDGCSIFEDALVIDDDVYVRSKDLLEVFPYFTVDQMRTIVSRCLTEGLLKSGFFTESKFDRTKWIALSDKAEEELRFSS